MVSAYLSPFATARTVLLITVFVMGSLIAGDRRADSAASNSAPVPAVHKKRALLVGVSKYARGSKERDVDWWDLNTKGDIEILADVLIRKFGFQAENVKVLADEPVTVDGKTIPPSKPTHKAIRDAFQDFIIDKAEPGDVVYFHFSGHGQQVPDDNGDEADGMDETIIPSDYVSQKDPGQNIRDDEIGIWLDGVSKKRPSNVTITLDSCFSGTATRGEDLPRGGPWKGNEIDRKFAGKSDDSFGDFVTRGEGGSTAIAREQRYVFISAASPRQTAKETLQEGVKYGAFTFAFAKALDNAGPRTTYRDLFENVTNYLTRSQRDQTPQIEGVELDNVIMTDGAIPTERYVAVQHNGPALYLQAGKLQGMTAGSKFALFPAGTKEFKESEMIALAQVDRVGPTSSAVTILGMPNAEKLKLAARAFETEHNYSDTLKVAIAKRDRGVSGVENVIKGLGLTEEVLEDSNKWNVLIRPPAADGSDTASKIISSSFHGVMLQRRDGSIIATVRDGPGMSEAVQNALKGEATWQLVKSFDDNTDPDLNVVSISLVPVSIVRDRITGEPIEMSELRTGFPSRGGKTELCACIRDAATHKCKPDTGDAVRLEIRNNGTRDVYVSILNLRSDGRIGPAFPIGNSDNLIKAGSSYKTPYAFIMEEPYGQESFRAIVTAKQTDFTPIIDPSLLARGPDTTAGRNAAESPIGKLLKSAVAGSRGELTAPPASWATSTVTYFVVPPGK